MILLPVDPRLPYEIMGLEDEASPASTGCTTRRVLKTTVTEAHSYIYAGGRLLRETITTTSAGGAVSTKVLDFAYGAQGMPYSLTYTNGTANPVTYYYITNTCASTVAAGAFIGSSTALAGAAAFAACELESLDDFASFGEAALLSTTYGAADGALAASTLTQGTALLLEPP